MKVTRAHDLTAPTGGTWREVPAADVVHALEQFRIVDVRQPDEFTGTLGHIQGADLVPLGTLHGVLETWDRSTPVLVVCRSGARSSRACDQLVQAGFEAVVNLEGGMIAWNSGGHQCCVSSHHECDAPTLK